MGSKPTRRSRALFDGRSVSAACHWETALATHTTSRRSAVASTTREKLLQSAMQVFAAKGYHGTTVDDIVAASATSKGAFYHYFASKQDIFLILVDALAGLVEAGAETAIAGETEALAKVEGALRVVLETAEAQRDLVKILLVEAVGLGAEFEQKRLDIHRRFAALIQRHLDHAVADGAIPPQNTGLASQAWLGTLNEIITQWLVANRGRVTEQLPDLRLLLLRSIGART
jgi:TetR/AcrR family transcriptional regulator, fatty acid metabolism regulator protein